MKKTICTISCGLLSLAQTGIFAGSAIWNLNGSGSWKKESNWLQSAGLNTIYPDEQNDIATFPPFIITKPVTVSIDGSVKVKSLVFNSDHQYTIASGEIQIYDSIWVTGQAAIKSDLVLQNNISMMANGNLPLSGNISGNGGITKQGEGTLTLTGNNTYTGMTIIQSGVFQAGTVNSFSPNSGVNIINTSGVVFDLNGFDNKIASLSGGGKKGGNILLDKGTLTVGDETNTVYEGAIFGSGGLTKVGSGTLTLSGTKSTYSGTTMIEGGTLQAGGPKIFSVNSKVVFADNEGVCLNLGGYDNKISSINGGGLYGGNIVLGKGNLILGDDTDSNILGTISGTGGIKKVGKGTLTLSRTNTYTGLTKIAEGTVILTGLISSPVRIEKGATLGGNGRVIGNVANFGSIDPDRMTIVGNYRQEKGTTLEIGVTSEGASLTTTGTFTIGNDVILNIVAPGAYTPGTVYEIISAGGGIIGSFAKMNFPEKFLIKTSTQNVTIEMK